MKHPILKPNGETYACVWSESGRLHIQVRFNEPPNMIVMMDEKVIPQLISALQAIEKEKVKT